ncbi:MAG: L,D-transpeptidase [Gammaproteobacteria bacterium]|nr:L,D-transpeptidase [Gammaproteobacteria bacterium]MBU1653395.1 L,D-transpeptidase [Gammaproteobacteria bacterium]MBU1960716.1 L,D-transpeptidase [Gammaproteobacteria bacterium]
MKQKFSFLLLAVGSILLVPQALQAETQTNTDARVRVIIGTDGQNKLASVPDALKLDLSRPAAAEAQATASAEASASNGTAPSHTGPAVRATIDLGQQRATIEVNGEVKHTWKVSSARYGYTTPNGTYKPQWLSRMHYSKQYDYSPMPFSVFFHEGYAIHGTDSIRRLGSPASHGCIRLHPDNAQTFFNLVKQHGKANSRIVIVGSPNHTWAERRRVEERVGYSGNSNGSSHSNPHTDRLTRPFSLDTYDL